MRVNCLLMLKTSVAKLVYLFYLHKRLVAFCQIKTKGSHHGDEWGTLDDREEPIIIMKRTSVPPKRGFRFYYITQLLHLTFTLPPHLSYTDEKACRGAYFY